MRVLIIKGDNSGRAGVVLDIDKEVTDIQSVYAYLKSVPPDALSSCLPSSRTARISIEP